MPAPPIDRPLAGIDGPLADQSAVRQSIGRLRGMTDLGRESSLSALGAINRPLRIPVMHLLKFIIIGELGEIGDSYDKYRSESARRKRCAAPAV
jgi:hypothetical protein